MSIPNVVVTGASAETPAGGSVGRLFSDVRFFLVRRLPIRSKYIEDIEANGGKIVKLESQADYVIADHLRADAPAGSYSWTLIDVALKTGQFPDPAEHAIRPPGAVREVGSNTMAKSTRTAYTAEDDRFLWNWVEKAKAEGYSVKGNDLYKKLEAENPRHTFQSWRDHYIKHLMGKPPPAGVAAAADSLPSPPVTADNDYVDLSAEGHGKFSMEALEKLLSNAEDIEKIAEELWDVAWDSFSASNEEHTASQWIALWTLKARPAYRAKLMESSAGDRDVAKDTNVPEEVKSSPKKRKQDVVSSPINQDRAKKQKTATSEAPRVNRELGPNVDRATSSKVRHDVHQGDIDKTNVETVVTSELNEAAGEQIQEEAATRTPLEPVFTSDLNEAAGSQIFRESGLKTNLKPVLTSDLNEAAGLQVQEEARRAQTNIKPVADSDLNNTATLQLGEEKFTQNQFEPVLTSDFNEAADFQINHEARTRSEGPFNQSSEHTALGVDAPAFGSDADVTGSNADAAIRLQDASVLVDDNEELSDVVENGDGVQSFEDTVVELPTGSPLALTAANLASQQAQHEPPDPRGIDLPRDDDNMDQEPYAKYLQSILSDGALQKKPGTTSLEAERDEQPGVQDRPTVVEGLSIQQLASAANVPVSPRAGHGSSTKDGTQRDTSEGRLRRPTPDKSRAMPSPRLEDRSAQAHAEFEISTRALMSQVNDATSSMPHASDSETREFGDLALPDFGEFVDEDDGSNARERDADQGDLRGESGDFKYDGDDIDLTVAEPDGGFEDSRPPSEDGYVDLLAHPHMSPGENTRSQRSVVAISSRQSSSSLSPGSFQFTPERSKGKMHAVETQDILNAETQRPDLTFPAPSEDDYKIDETEAETVHSQRQLGKNRDNKDRGKGKKVEPSALATAEAVNEWVSIMVLRGHRQLAAVHALQRASMRPDLALLVLVEARMGNGLPSDVPGIWSEEEDKTLESGDAGGLAALKDKHGWHEMEARMGYLDDWRSLA